MIATLRLGGGLILLVLANIAIGSIRAAIARQWVWRTFWNGVIKGLIVVGAFAAVYLAGWLNPDVIVIELDGQMVDLEMAVYLVLLAGAAYYAVKVLGKLKEIVTEKTSSEGEEQKANSDEKGG